MKPNDPIYKVHQTYAKKRLRLLVIFGILSFLFLLFVTSNNITLPSASKTIISICAGGSITLYLAYIIHFLRKVKCPRCNRACRPSAIGHHIERRVVCEHCHIIWGLDYGGVSTGQASDTDSFDACDGE